MKHLSKQDIVVIGDFHVASGAPHSDPFTGDAAFAAFASHVVAGQEAASRGLRLLVMGDLLDFPAIRRAGDALGEDALACLDAAAEAHRELFDAFRRCVAAGLVIDVLIGNHDIQLCDAAVQDSLRARLGASRYALRFHPWFLHLPGVLYAEHGDQYHPLVRVVNGFERASANPSDGSVWTVMRRAASRVRLWNGRPRPRQPATTGGDVGLPVAALAQIDAIADGLATITPANVANRVRRGPAWYLYDGARAVDAELRREGLGVPLYVFGHSHLPELRRLPGAGLYANAGTWSSICRAWTGGDVRQPLTYIRVSLVGAEPVSQLFAWDAASGEAVPLCGANGAADVTPGRATRPQTGG